MTKFIPYIRFPLMQRTFFTKEVYTSQVLTGQQSMNILLYFVDNQHQINFNSRVRCSMKYVSMQCKKCSIIQQENERLMQQLLAIQREQNEYKFLPFELHMSCKYKGKEEQPPNNFISLVNSNLDQGCATTDNSQNTFIEAIFGDVKTVTRIEIGPAGNGMGADYLNNRHLQYKNTSGNWIEWKTITDFKMNELRSINVDNIETSAFRLYHSMGYITVGCLRFFGH